MGKLILILLLLFNINYNPPVDAGGTTMEDPGYLDRYMELMERRSERGPIPLDEQIRVLEEFGITISDETIAKMGPSAKDGPGCEYWETLMMEGWGTYDYDTRTWTPTSNQVYSFDAEFYDVEGMYQIYLQGLQSISQGELTFSNITTDYSKADYSNRVGSVDVRFMLNGKECRFEASFMGDWLDLRIRDAVNQCLEELGIEKRFYATDGSQGETILFCTEEWAREFEEATLCCMSVTAVH